MANRKTGALIAETTETLVVDGAEREVLVRRFDDDADGAADRAVGFIKVGGDGPNADRDARVLYFDDGADDRSANCIVSYEYYANGKWSSVAEDRDGDGRTDRETTYTRDGEGNITALRIVLDRGPGNPKVTKIIDDFAATGYRPNRKVFDFNNNDNADQTIDYTYHATGLPETVTRYAGSSPAIVHRIRYERDADGAVTAAYRERDRDGNGIVDRVDTLEEFVHNRGTETAPQLVTWRRPVRKEYDDGGGTRPDSEREDGVADWSETIVYAENQHSPYFVAVYSKDSDNDGVFDVVVTNTRDAFGGILEKRWDRDTDDDGDVDAVSVSNRRSDREWAQRKYFDDDGDGAWDRAVHVGDGRGTVIDATADPELMGAGPDRIDGRAGDDTLTGGGGADRFVFRPGDGADTITDFAFGLDRILFAGPLEAGDVSIRSTTAAQQAQADAMARYAATGEWMPEEPENPFAVVEVAITYSADGTDVVTLTGLNIALELMTEDSIAFI